MPLSDAAILVYEQKQKIMKCPDLYFYLYVTSFICTNFEAFTTFRAILHVLAVLYGVWSNFFGGGEAVVDAPGGICYVGVLGDVPFSWVYFLPENSEAGLVLFAQKFQSRISILKKNSKAG